MYLGGWNSERMVLRYAHMNVGHLSQSVATLPWENPGSRSSAVQKEKSYRRLACVARYFGKGEVVSSILTGSIAKTPIKGE